MTAGYERRSQRQPPRGGKPGAHRNERRARASHHPVSACALCHCNVVADVVHAVDLACNARRGLLFGPTVDAAAQLYHVLLRINVSVACPGRRIADQRRIDLAGDHRIRAGRGLSAQRNAQRERDRERSQQRARMRLQMFANRVLILLRQRSTHCQL
jgi:hypothetical protein